MANVKRSNHQAFLRKNPDLKGIDLIISDLNGVFRGKRIQASALDKVFQDGICLPASVFALDILGNTVEESGLGVSTGDSDRICMPISDSISIIPWSPKPMAQVLLTMLEEDGSPFFADPRQVLSKVLEKFSELKLTPVVAVELEFYLLDKRRNKQKKPQPPISPVTGKREADTQVYSVDNLDDYKEFLDEVARFAKVQGLPADTAVAEYAPGQFEINLQHVDDPILACDHAILLKRLIKGVARNMGLNASFMAKPFSDQAGSGTHIHFSLLDRKKKNVFMGKKDKTDSPFLQHAVGGLAKTMKESTAIFCPNANSYRRFQPDLYVPMAPTWGIDNRTVALRIPSGSPKSTRIEHRVAGADTNPYLTMAALLVGIHYGITQKIKPPKISTGDAIAKNPPSLPMNWAESLQAFSKGKILRQYFGKDFCHVFHETRKKEMENFDSQITPLELDWYLRTV